MFNGIFLIQFFGFQLCMSRYIHIQMFMHFGQGAALAFQQIVLRNYGDRNSDWKKLFGRNSQPESSITGESREYGNQSSARKNDWAGTSMRYILFLFFW